MTNMINLLLASDIKEFFFHCCSSYHYRQKRASEDTTSGSPPKKSSAGPKRDARQIYNPPSGKYSSNLSNFNYGERFRLGTRNMRLGRNCVILDFK